MRMTPAPPRLRPFKATDRLPPEACHGRHVLPRPASCPRFCHPPDLVAQVQYRKAEKQVLRSKLPKRVTVTDAEKARLVKLGLKVGSAIRELITIVSPRTFTRWAMLDGFSRRLLALRVYARPPRANHAAALVRGAAREYGTPRFVITDHGSQFGMRFIAAMKKAGIHHVQGQVRNLFLNGKIERYFRPLRNWWRCTLPTLTVSGLQTKLDWFRE